MNESLWYLGRGFGVSALVLLSMVVAFVIVVRTGRPLPRLSRAAQLTLHRVLSLTAVEVVVLHLVTLWADPYAQLRLVDMLVPFRAALHPVGLGLGTLAVELLGAVVVSSLVRRRIGWRVWRAVHWAAYLLWPAAVVHALASGTDRSAPWFLLTVAACGATVGAAWVWRLVNRRHEPGPRPSAPPAELAGVR